ncbi:MAG: hypothetical protein P8M16_11440 [Acidimicrobiales bacterium]|nr:hypothetical protein [Acidimicrobiales bacterium]
MRTGIQPGSFDPPTLAHLVIAHTALRYHHLDQIIWSVSRRPLGKDRGRTSIEDRLVVLQDVAATHRWLTVEATDARLIADLAQGHDVVVMGADKWHQLHDSRFYGEETKSEEAEASMAKALNRLPTCAVAPRNGLEVPPDMVLPVPNWVAKQSSSQAVSDATWMSLSAARQSNLWSEQR